MGGGRWTYIEIFCKLQSYATTGFLHGYRICLSQEEFEIMSIIFVSNTHCTFLSTRFFFYKKQTFCFQPGCFLIFCQFQPQMFLKCFLKFLKLLITTTDDNIVQPEGLPNYQVPPVSSLDPTSNTPDNQKLDDGLLSNKKFLTTTVFSSLLPTSACSCFLNVS